MSVVCAFFIAERVDQIHSLTRSFRDRFNADVDYQSPECRSAEPEYRLNAVDAKVVVKNLGMAEWNFIMQMGTISMTNLIMFYMFVMGVIKN